MSDFNDIRSASKDEQIRAWCLEQVIDFARDSTTANDKSVIAAAARFEKFIIEGSSEANSDA